MNKRAKVVFLTISAMTFFAANSLLCRVSLTQTAIDPASFTFVRIVSGALALWLIAQFHGAALRGHGNWVSGGSLFLYCASFSLAYLALTAGTGALILFGMVQITMIGHGLWRGERPSVRQVIGLVIAFGGLCWLVLPGLSAPPWRGSLLMMVAGVAWGAYSIRGKGTASPTLATAGNFLRAVPFAAGFGILAFPWLSLDAAGILYGATSGAITSGLGYVVWYTALGGLSSTQAATAQLTVPAIAAGGGTLFLAEPITWHLIISSLAILGGVAVVVFGKERRHG
ncbi:MAG TPA: DMT family transporter [Paralcaligenes sp.]